MLPDISVWASSWALLRLAGAWNPVQALQTDKLEAKRRCRRVLTPENDMAVETEAPAQLLHPRSGAFEILAQAKGYPHRFHNNPEDHCDQVQWPMEGAEGELNLHPVVPYRLRSLRSRRLRYLRFVNTTSHRVRLLWIDYNGNEVAYEIVNPGQAVLQQTFATHPWIVREVETCTRLLLNSREAVVAANDVDSMLKLIGQPAVPASAQQHHQEEGQQQEQQLPQAPTHEGAQQQQQQQDQQAPPAAAVQVQVQQAAIAQPLAPAPQQHQAAWSAVPAPIQTVLIQNLPQLTWTKETHACFPESHKAGIRTFLMCHQKLQQQVGYCCSSSSHDSSHLGMLPTLLLPHIVAMAALIVPQGVHYPAIARQDIKPALLPRPPAEAVKAVFAPAQGPAGAPAIHVVVPAPAGEEDE